MCRGARRARRCASRENASRVCVRDRRASIGWRALALLWLPTLLLPAEAGAAAPRWIGPARPPAEVTRVVTLAPSLTETVVALGRQQALVGVSRFDDAPAVATLPRVGAADGISLEALVALRPQLVLAQPTAGNVRNFQTLAALKIPVLLLPTETLEETGESLVAAGRAMGRAGQGRALAATLRETRARLRARTASWKKPRVLIVVGFDPLVVAGPGSYLDALLADAGGINAASDAAAAWSVYPLERAAASRPEVILDASEAPAGRASLTRLPTLAAARWVEPPSHAMLRPGPSLARGLEELAMLLHGPRVLTRDPPGPKAGGDVGRGARGEVGPRGRDDAVAVPRAQEGGPSTQGGAPTSHSRQGHSPSGSRPSPPPGAQSPPGSMRAPEAKDARAPRESGGESSRAPGPESPSAP